MATSKDIDGARAVTQIKFEPPVPALLPLVCISPMKSAESIKQVGADLRADRNRYSIKINQINKLFEQTPYFLMR